MRKMIIALVTLIGISMGALPALSYAYGSGPAPVSSGCKPPKFSNATPAGDAAVSSISEFAITASPNTDKSLVEAKVNGEAVELDIEEKRSGTLVITAKLATPITEAGYATFTIAAKDKSKKCTQRKAVRVMVEPDNAANEDPDSEEEEAAADPDNDEDNGEDEDAEQTEQAAEE